MVITEDNPVLDQVQRILVSDELRGADELRRLLKFLAEKSITGAADELKEYTIAIDGLGKPSSYDPRHNSAVRIQVARLRQKLADYYRTEGVDDRVILEVPKGSFRLTCQNREISTRRTIVEPIVEAAHEPADVLPPQIKFNKRYFRKPAGLSFASLLWAILLAAIFIAVHSWINPWSARATNNSALSGWTPELEDLWGPFIDSKRPLVVTIEDPLFVELQWGNGIYYRDRLLNDWKDVPSSTAVSALRSALHDPEIQPSQYYTSFGEVNVSFMIGKLLGPRVQNFSLTKTSELSWQQLADNNILFAGMQNRFFDQQMQAMPIEVQLLPVLEGVRNVHPRPGEPALYADQYSNTPTPSGGGIVYALVTHLPGPQGNNDVESFTSNHSAGYVAAVRAFVDPSFSRQIVEKLRQNSGGKMPRYFQILFKVKFRDEVPVETTCVLARQLP
jgi:hypothetical protein